MFHISAFALLGVASAGEVVVMMGGPPGPMFLPHQGPPPGVMEMLLQQLPGAIARGPRQPRVVEVVLTRPNQFGAPGVSPQTLGRMQAASDPFLDIHRQLRMFAEANFQSLGQIGRPQAQHQFLNHLELFGGAEGSFGTTGGFKVEQDEKEVRITGHLPGHFYSPFLEKKLRGNSPPEAEAEHAEDENPLTVRMVGKTLVVSGQVRGPWGASRFQQNFELPASADAAKMAVSYEKKSGDLKVVVPKDASIPTRSPEDKLQMLRDSRTSPRDLHMLDSLDAFFGDMGNIVQVLKGDSLDDEVLHEKFSGKGEQPARRRGEVVEKKLHDLFELSEPKPFRGSVPDDAVEYVGCFNEADLAASRTPLKGVRAGSFLTAFDAAAGKGQDRYFGLARHGAPLLSGEATLLIGRPSRPPLADKTCGSACEDDPARHCGCLHEADFKNPACEAGTRRLAVYRVVSSALQEDGVRAKIQTAAQAAAVAEEAEERAAVWHLEDDALVVSVRPEVQRFEVDGHVVKFYGSGRRLLSSVRLPVEIKGDICALKAYHAPVAGGAGKLLRCEMRSDPVPVHIVDEL